MEATNESKENDNSLEWKKRKILKEKCKMKKQNLISLWQKKKEKYQGGSRWDEIHYSADGRKDVIDTAGGKHASAN